MNTKARIGCGLLVIFALFVIGFGYYRSQLKWVDAGYVGIKFSAGSGVDKTRTYKPGAYYLGPFNQFYFFPTKIENAVYTQDSNAGEVKAADGILITTKDTANTTFDVSVIYRISDPFLALDTFGPIPIETIQAQHIRKAVKEESSVVGNLFDIYSLMGPSRLEASGELTKRLQGKLAKKGIEVIQAMILTAYPSKDLVTKIHNNVNSVTQIQIATLNQQIATKQNLINICNAEATQKSQQIMGAQTSAKSLQIIDLELAMKAVKAWKGHLPLVAGSSANKSVILSPSELQELAAQQRANEARKGGK